MLEFLFILNPPPIAALGDCFTQSISFGKEAGAGEGTGIGKGEGAATKDGDSDIGGFAILCFLMSNRYWLWSIVWENSSSNSSLFKYALTLSFNISLF